jgi:hypothetical protein
LAAERNRAIWVSKEGRMPEQLEADAHAGGGHGTKSVIAALLANLGIAVAKFIGWLVTGASSMLAEALHSVADSGNQAMLLLGSRLARREPDPNHPFGHGRVRYFAAFLVAVVLFTLGALFSLYEGYQKLHHPHALETPAVALAILAVGLVLEGLSLRTAAREAHPLRGEQSWWSSIRTTKNPELAVVDGVPGRAGRGRHRGRRSGVEAGAGRDALLEGGDQVEDLERRPGAGSRRRPGR